MIRIKRERRKVTLKRGTKDTRTVEVSGFRPGDHTVVVISPVWFRAEEEKISVETWKERE